jgi:hypothetical protein
MTAFGPQRTVHKLRFMDAAIFPFYTSRLFR